MASNCFGNIKSKYIIKRIFSNLKENRWLKIIKCNKIIQNKLNIDVNYYKRYNNIEIELIPINKEYENKFIKISNKEHESYIHIFFNNDKNEIKKNYFTKNENITKIKVIVDFEVKSLSGLFEDCKCLKSIKFLKFIIFNILINMLI